jgi:hypothetical protein
MVEIRPQLIVVSGLSVGIPLTVRFRPQLVVVSGLSVGIPLTVRFRPQFGVVSGAFRWESLWGGILEFYGAFGYHEAFSQTLPFHEGILAITKPFTQTFLFHDAILAIKEPFTRTFLFVEFWLSRSLFTNFSITRWNSGYQGAFSWISLSHDGILAIKEPFHEFLFHTMESLLSRSLFTKFSFTRWNSQNARFGGRLFSYISQRVFTWAPPR